MAGTQGLYGDGSAGAFTVGSGQTVDLTTPTGVSQLPSGFNLQFSSINIVGTLIVPSGTVLRSSGDITVSGTLTVRPGAEDLGGGQAPAGVARTAAGSYSGGVGLASFQGAQVRRVQNASGGAGARLYAGAGANGGAGGGAVMLAARGNVRIVVGGTINASGVSGVNPQTAGQSIVGTGGGGGGIVLVAAKGTITLGGIIRAQGGNGADGFNGNAGTGEGGGGGGGGGIVHFIASASPSVTGSVVVSEGSAGANAPAQTGTSILTAGGGGGSGGSGGNGGGIIPGTTTNGNASAGTGGYFLQTVVPEPESLLGL
ncbi:hypothetical protein D7X75_17705 [Corallococcus sp. CA031C]|nr:hypothetical protein D7X75_17705 [Corallococcus sp. CA031C]